MKLGVKLHFRDWSTWNHLGRGYLQARRNLKGSAWWVDYGACEMLTKRASAEPQMQPHGCCAAQGDDGMVKIRVNDISGGSAMDEKDMQSCMAECGEHGLLLFVCFHLLFAPNAWSTLRHTSSGPEICQS